MAPNYKAALSVDRQIVMGPALIFRKSGVIHIKHDFSLSLRSSVATSLIPEQNTFKVAFIYVYGAKKKKLVG